MTHHRMLRRALVAAVGSALAIAGLLAAPSLAQAAAPASTWHVQKVLPDRPGAMLAVSCPSAKTCFAIGGDLGTRAYSWDGGAWVPTKIRGTSGLNTYNLTCASPKLCEVISWYYGDTSYEVEVQNERWNGSEWKGGYFSDSIDLFDNSCVAPSFCMDVGGSYHNGIRVPGYETGTRRYSFNLGYNGYFDSTSCPSATFCLSTGHYRTQKGGAQIQFVTTWDGTTMTRVPAPKGNVAQVSCASRTYCLAIGHGHPASNRAGWVSPAWVWRGTKAGWSPVPLPVTAKKHPSLNDVQCTSATTCTGVGVDDPTGEVAGRSTVAHWNGKSWTIIATPNSGGKTARNALTSVDCRTRYKCVAAGYYTPKGASHDYPLVVSNYKLSTK